MTTSGFFRQLCFLCAALLLAACQQQPMRPPAAVLIPSSLSQDQVAQAIRLALHDRGWTLTATKPGELDADFTKPSEYDVHIAVVYDNSSININYVDSSGLQYEERDGQKYIHYRYMDWMRFLCQSLSSRLALAVVGQQQPSPGTSGSAPPALAPAH